MAVGVIVAALLLAGCQIAGAFLTVWMLSRHLRRLKSEVKAELAALVADWVTQPAEGEPSKLAQVTDMMGAVIGSSAARSIMASLNAGESHAARAANTAADNMQAQSNPLLALLAGGKRGKGAAVMRLAEMLGGMFGGGAATPGGAGQLPLIPGAPGNNGGGSVADRLRRKGE